MSADIVPMPYAEAHRGEAPPRALGRLGLSPVEQRAVTALVSEGGEAVAAHVAERATAFASGDAGVRRRAIARSAAVEEALMGQYSALLASAVARQDHAAAKLLNGTLTSATARYRSLMEALRFECNGNRRVIVAARGEIAVTATE